MRNYEYHSINEMGKAEWSMNGKPSPRFTHEMNLKKNTNSTLLANFLKCAMWIEKHCPNLNGKFPCRHQVYHWTQIVVENGKAYLEYGDHGYDFTIALSSTETAVMSRGSCQSKPYAFEDILFFRNDALQEFLSQWDSIKTAIIYESRTQNQIFSDGFQP